MKTIILTRKLVSGDQIIKMHKINFTRKLTFGHIFMGLVIKPPASVNPGSKNLVQDFEKCNPLDKIGAEAPEKIGILGREAPGIFQVLRCF